MKLTERYTKFQEHSLLASLLEEVFIRSWWVVFFILFCCIGYEQGLKKLHVDYRKLNHQYKELTEEYQKVFEQHKYLEAELFSFNDPDWIELVLRKELGLVPENQTKVYFKE